MEKTYRKKIMGAAGVFFALLLLCAAPAFSEITGELGVSGVSTDETEGMLNINREFNMLPKGMSVSLLRLDIPMFHKQGGYFRMLGTDLGEGDVYTTFQGAFSRNLTGEGGYEKTPHTINLASGYFTYRDTERLRFNIYPLGKLNATVSYSNEDKSGRLNNATYVGQKTRSKSTVINGTLGNAVVSLGIDDNELRHSTLAHNMDGVSLTVTLNPSTTDRFFGQLAYSEREFGASMTNTATNTVELKNTDLSAAYALRDNVTLMTGLSMRKRNSSRSVESLSYDDDAYNFGVRIRSRIGRLGLSYKKADRDYSGGCVTSGGCTSSRNTETIKVKGSTNWLFFGIKAEYEHANRDTAGGGTTLWNFSQLPGEFVKQKLSANLLGFKKFTSLLYLTNNKDTYLPGATYGTTGYRTKVSGISTVYMAEPNLDFTLDVSNMQSRMTGRQAMQGGQWDFTLNGVDTDTKYYTIGSHYYCKSGSVLSWGYSSASSNLADPQNSNQVRERTLSVNIEKPLSKKHTITAGISRTHFSDQLNSDIADKNTVMQFEILRKF